MHDCSITKHRRQTTIMQLLPAAGNHDGAHSKGALDRERLNGNLPKTNCFLKGRFEAKREAARSPVGPGRRASSS
jgi:hypothetical protein